MAKPESVLKTADPERYATLLVNAANARAARSRKTLLAKRVEAIHFLNSTASALSADELKAEPAVRSA